MAPKGQVLGFDLDDTVYIPIARALEVFNREGVMEIHVAYRARLRRCKRWSRTSSAS